MTVVLATRNAHKVRELRRILNDAELSIDVIDVPEAERRAGVEVPEIAETGTTFEDNALLKAEGVCAVTGLPSLADDSGLCVDALNGMPGIYSARWSGPAADDAANLTLLIGQMSALPDDRRAAQFVCAAAFVCPDQPPTVVVGSLVGSLITEPRGTAGFGYDPIFVPEGETRTTAQMTAAEKDAISHRGRAFRRLALTLADRFALTGEGC
ncbi:MAG: RdgB/HAM1 family non-canonical purine NTP pyrophosphatase [Candidatus Nanopelagicales bacterium]